MRFHGHGWDKLNLERHSAFVPANLGQQPVVETFATTQTVATRVEGYARNEHQVQLV